MQTTEFIKTYNDCNGVWQHVHGLISVRSPACVQRKWIITVILFIECARVVRFQMRVSIRYPVVIDSPGFYNELVFVKKKMNFCRMGELPLFRYWYNFFPFITVNSKFEIFHSILSLKFCKNLKRTYSINRTKHKRRGQLKWKQSSTFFFDGHWNFQISKS